MSIFYITLTFKEIWAKIFPFYSLSRPKNEENSRINRVSKIIRNEYWCGHLASVTTEILGIIAEIMSIYVDRYPIQV